ncbi:hypothetical protein E0H75_41665 [Kribbella capetownensis]|uniref:Uncharacterized protein n=2 Tax=Kribbella capetownensis TaxID=1572659 RepID=A0A4R0INR2_9ACTN|nr:hypothetical protein E0H75_41665 [Kribbella capetownensis]
MGAAVIGRRRYSGSAAAEPAGPDSVTWHMTYRVEEEGEVVAEFTASDHWYVLTPAELATEVAEHGLRVRAGDAAQGLHIITR